MVQPESVASQSLYLEGLVALSILARNFLLAQFQVYEALAAAALNCTLPVLKLPDKRFPVVKLVPLKHISGGFGARVLTPVLVLTPPVYLL
eukprot:3825057-Rhodomonas_salina.3